MGYKFGQKPKRGLRKRLPQLLVVFGVFVLGASGASALVYTGKLSMPGSGEQNKSNSGVIGMGRNANIFAPENPGDADVQGAASHVRSLACGNLAPVRPNLAAARTPLLRKMAEYEQVCGGAVAQRVMFFVATPKDKAEAHSLGIWVASVLRDFADHNVLPLVIFEPSFTDGSTVDFKAYRTGSYDAALDAYFATLKAQGVTDETMGMWVPFPEGNIPVWTSVNPGDFAANVTKTVQVQKKYFPGSKAAVLLESKTYPTANSWAGGKFVSLLPYVQGIPKGLIDSFGLQGFAWPPTSEGEAPMLEPKTFLQIGFAAEAARSLGVADIWLNTGTFGTSYVLGRDKPFALSPTERQAVLDGVVAQAKALQSQGFNPAVHIFAKDKSGLTEGIDWSYWKQDQAATGSATSVFKTLAHDLHAANIPLWLFDSAED